MIHNFFKLDNIMEQVLIVFVILYVGLVVWNRSDSSNQQYQSVQSEVDGNSYLVQKKFVDSKEASNLLASIKNRLDILIVHLKKTHPNDVRTQRILSRFDTSNIVENDTSGKFTSFTQNKGERMVFCLRTRDNRARLHPINLMMFVAIHELGHVCSESVGHDDPEFWENFAFLLREAVKINVWRYTDFKKNPTTYCGMRITNSVI